MRLTLFLIFTLIYCYAFAQEETIVYGRILEKGKPEPIPFVSIGFKGTKTGTTSNFEGNYIIKTTLPVDTIVITYVGYKTIKKKIRRGEKQLLNIELQQQTSDLREVTIKPGINPALRIIKRAQEMREVNDQDKLSSYEFDSYNKIDVSMNNISEQMKNKAVFKPIRSLLDTSKQMKNEEGKYILPIFISESYSRLYQNVNPSKTKEQIRGSSITGVGVNEGSYVIDLLGASMLQFNFNQNWLRILGKDFISPIASGSMSYYIYTLLDSVDIEGTKCYKIKINLRREEDLGFLGMMWITDSTYAIKRIDAEISPSANVNFVDRLKIQQEMEQTTAGPYLPVKIRMIFDIAEMSKNSSGFIAKMYRSNSNIEVNKIRDQEFFDVRVEREPDMSDKDSAFWGGVRKEPFTKVENQMFLMIDSIKNLPVIKTYIDVIRLVLEGHYRIGKLDWGPYVFLVGYNNVEEVRFRLGFRTNQFFSKSWQLKTYLAYGTNDMQMKYGLGADYIISKRKWTTIGASFKDDYDILGVTDVNTVTLQKSATSNLFAAFSFATPRARINRTIDYRINFITQPKRDWTFRASVQNTWFDPLGKFFFAYKRNPLAAETIENILHDYTYTAATVETRFAYKELMMVRGIERTRLVRAKAPILTLSYTRGIKGVLGGQFDFDKVQLNVSQHITTGFLGNADYSITAGKIFGVLPYPVLDVPSGNQTFLYSENNYSLMNMYEFVADEYSHFSWVQHFEGLFFNRVPLLGKWKLRNFALLKATYGHLSEENKNLLPVANRNGIPVSPITAFKDEPYVEVGYGIENIFRVLSIGSFHRLTYLNSSDRQVRSWGINLGIRITF